MTRLRSSLLAMTLTTMAVAASAQNNSTQAPAPAPKPSPKAPSTVTVSGCVGGGKSAGDPYTITSDDGAIAYKLSGKNMRQFLGQRVTIVGNNDTRRLKIVGGLTPSPNAAAQAGAISPEQAAIAGDPLATASKTDQALPEFRVRLVQTSGASCH